MSQYLLLVVFCLLSCAPRQTVIQSGKILAFQETKPRCSRGAVSQGTPQLVGRDTLLVFLPTLEGHGNPIRWWCFNEDATVLSLNGVLEKTVLFSPNR